MYTGFLLLLLAGICQGSFGLGYKKYHPFSWAAFWGIYNILCIITAVTFAAISAPALGTVISRKGFSYCIIPLLCGALWGLSAIGFSKGISKIGMSMVYGISMGISTIVGSVMPLLLEKTFPSGNSLILFSVGLILTLIGVVVITVAGVRRDGGTKRSASGSILAVLSGLGSGAMNIGFTHSEFISTEFAKLGYSQTAISSGKWLLVLIGGCVMGLIWCIGELFAKHEWKTVIAKGSVKRTIILFGVSIVWYLALLLYGLSSARLGDMGDTTGWILFNSLALIISVCWGLASGEWKNKNKTTLFTGCAVLIIAWIFTALA